MTATTDGSTHLSDIEEDADYKFLVGVHSDIRRRLNPTSWMSDWRDGLRWQVFNASFFMFFASIAPPLAFAQTLMDKTGGEMGLIELVVSTALCGAIFAVLAGQPLNIVGVTGPTIILWGAMYGVAEKIGAPFLPFMGWACVWAASMLCTLGIFGAAALAKSVTRFTDEIFGGLIALVYLSVAIEGFARQFTHIDLAGTSTSSGSSSDSVGTLSGALLSLLLAFATAATCLALHFARGWKSLRPTARDLLARYNTCLALLVFTGVSYWGVLRDAHVERLHSVVPAAGMWDGRPTADGRAWLVPLLAPGIGATQIFTALIPGVLMVFLLFFDHSVVALVSAAPQFRLRKGSAFHWDTVLLGLTVLLCGLLGLPPVNGVLPQSPMHVQACAILKTKTKRRRKEARNAESGGVEGDDEGDDDEGEGEDEGGEYAGVHENRVSPLAQSVLCALVLAVLPGVREIPIAVLWGLFLYFGASSVIGNQMAERCASFLLPASGELARLRREHERAGGRAAHAHLVGPPRRVVAAFTAVQLACLAAVVYVSEHAPAPEVKIAFAVLIVLLVPLRSFVLPLCFSPVHLRQLDGHADAHDDRSDDDDEHTHTGESLGDGDFPHSVEAGAVPPRHSHSHHPRVSLAYPSRGSVRTVYTAPVPARTATRASTCSRRTLARVTMPAMVPGDGARCDRNGSLNTVTGMAPGPVRAQSEAGQHFKAQHGEMLLRMRRREAQPNVDGFRSRRGLLNKMYPLMEM